MSVKDISSEFGHFTTDSDLADLVENLTVLKPSRSNLWPSLSGLPRDLVEEEIFPNGVDAMGEDAKNVAHLVAEICDIPIDRIALIGSHITQLSSKKKINNDYDFSLRLAPQEANALRGRLARIRISGNGPYTGENRRIAFQYALTIRCKKRVLIVDLFPSVADFPLGGAKKWTILEPIFEDCFEVGDVSWSHGAWPLLINPNGQFLVVQSNAFRGAFAPGDQLSYHGLNVEIDLGCRRTTVHMILNPFRSLKEWKRYLSYDRDLLWLT